MERVVGRSGCATTCLTPPVVDFRSANHAGKPHTDIENLFNTHHQHEIVTEILSLSQTPGNRTWERNAIINMEEDEALATTGQSKSGKEERGSQFQLQFVTTVSVNIPSKAEKRRNQKIIRQTVMKNFRQQQRTGKIPVKGKNRGLAATSGSDPESDEPESSKPSSSASPASSRSESKTLCESESKKEVKRSSRQTSQHLSDLGSPLSPLGAGRTDPFRPGYANTSPHTHELIDHSKWPCADQSPGGAPHPKSNH
jgi:hypothetical protein